MAQLPMDGYNQMPNRQAPQMSDPLPPAGGSPAPTRITNKPAPTRFMGNSSRYQGMDIKARRAARRSRFGNNRPNNQYTQLQERFDRLPEATRQRIEQARQMGMQRMGRSTFAPPRPQQMPTYNRVMSNQPVNQGGTVGGNVPVLDPNNMGGRLMSAEYRGPGSSGPSTILVPQDDMAGGVVPAVQASTPEISAPPFNARERLEQMPSFGQGGLLQNTGFLNNARRGFFNRVR